MSARKPRPVITVVGAKPMNETGFRQEQTTTAQPKLSPREYQTSAFDASPTSPSDRSSFGSVQILPHSGSGKKPAKPDRNFTVRYDPHSTEGSRISPVKPRRSASPENVTASASRPVPRPRPRSMVASKSQPSGFLAGQDDKVPSAVRPETANKPAVSATKGYHVVGTSIWYDGQTNLPQQPPQRPPPIKPKPVIAPATESIKTAEPVLVALSKSPSESRRRRPTIIRPTASSAEETTSLHGQSTVSPPPSGTRMTASSANAAGTVYEANGWNKPKSRPQGINSDVVNRASLNTTTASEGVKPQPKKRPTIIRMSRGSSSETPCANEIAKNGQLTFDSAKNQEKESSSSRSATKVSHDASVSNLQSRSFSSSGDHGSEVGHKRHLVSQGSDEDHQELRPVPRSQSQPLHCHEQELSRRIPPAKPPPPGTADKEERQKSPISRESVKRDRRAREKPPRPISQPPPRPAAPPASHPGPAPALPKRPSLGHPLYHYVAQGPHALALFDYAASQSDELSFTAGEIICLESWVNNEWMSGRTGSCRGMFPVNFVEIVEPLTSTPSSLSPSGIKEKSSSHSATELKSGPRCMARFDYEATEADDLGFVAGDVIRLTDYVGEEWLRGELKGKVGVFPLAFVEIIEHLPVAAVGDVGATSTASRSLSSSQDDQQPYCIAAYDFPGETAEDLSFKAGDRISLLKRINSDWLQGSLKGREGMFPSAFVEVIRDVDELPPRPKMHQQPSYDISPSSATAASFDSGRSLPSKNPSTLGSSHVDAGTVGRQAVALYDFDGDDPSDLIFRAGETIVDVRTVSEEWMSGRIGDRTGNFPTVFVQISSDS